MLRFVEKYDKSFRSALTISLEMMQRNLENIMADDNKKRGLKDYKDSFPLSSRYFTPQEVYDLITKIVEANEDNTTLYWTTDYHFALCYESLNHIGSISVRGKERELDLDYIFDCYFWDTDFLFTQEQMLDSSLEKKEVMGIRQETFGVVNGMKPCLVEIELRIEEKGDFKPVGYNRNIFVRRN
jgi:hypothetical protein